MAWLTPPETIDIRNLLEVNIYGEPREWVDEDHRVGIAVHYSGPTVNLAKDDLTLIKNEASYHCGKDWDENTWGIQGGDGLMYHMVVGRHGEIWQTRDLDSLLWHAGPKGNYGYYAVHCPIGVGQRATTAQLASLWKVCDSLRAYHGWSRDRVVGHQELMGTSCPGPLMVDFVYPYREEGAFMADGMELNDHYVGGGIFKFWNTRGGTEIFGYPLSEEYDTVAEDKEPVTAQWFERARFEYVKRTRVVRLARVGAELKDVVMGAVG